MDLFSMVTTIVVVGVVGGTVNTWIKHRARTVAVPPAQPDPAVQRELIELRQRVAALEAIVTEPAFELRRQIEELEPRRGSHAR